MQKHTSCITDRGQVTAMNLFEYEGKSILKQYDIPVPDSQLVVSEKETAPMDFPFVLKAQVMTGGRGKAGGVKVCHDASEYSTYAHDIINMTIKGHQVHGLLAAPSRSFSRTVTAGKPRGQRRIPPLPSIGSAAVPAVNNLSGLLPDILLTPGISVARFLGEQRKDLFLSMFGVLRIEEPALQIRVQHLAGNRHLNHQPLREQLPCFSSHGVPSWIHGHQSSPRRNYE